MYVPASTSRRRLLARIAALLLFAGIGLPAAAEPVPASLAVALARPSAAFPDTASQVVVRGRAPLHCAPVIGNVGLDGANLSIELVSPEAGCDTRQLAGFALAVDPRAAGGLPFLPERVLRVRIFARDSGPAELVAFRLLDASRSGPASIPENGFWWSQPGNGATPSPGTGASFEWQGGQLVVGLFGFSDTGAATWSFGSARSVGRTASVTLVELAGGDPPFAPTGNPPSAEVGPRLELEFLSPISARAWLVRQEDGRDVEVRPLSLARSRFDDAPPGAAWSGRWVLVGDDTAQPPRTFELGDPGSQDADRFHLDASDGTRLECRLAAATRQPDLCTLNAGGQALADFDEVGLDRLGGRDQDGRAIRLLRVPR